MVRHPHAGESLRVGLLDLRQARLQTQGQVETGREGERGERVGGEYTGEREGEREMRVLGGYMGQRREEG